MKHLFFLAAMLLAFSLSTTAEDAKEEAKETMKETAKVATEQVKYEYIGADKCKICHKKSGIYESWLATKHAWAWDSLSAENQKCEEHQKYYTTGTTAKGELLTGVQCEACHGPGSAYKKKSIMEDREKSIANGLLMPDENTCKRCHHEKAPPKLAALAKDFDFEKMKAKGIHMIPAKEASTKEEAAPKKVGEDE
jgi:mono/diheme cytochrome c family protein